MNPVIGTLVFAGSVGIALLAGNLFFDRTGNFVWSRKLVHFLVGCVFLASPWLFSGNPHAPIAMSAFILLVFAITNKRELFYGVQRRTRYSEQAFAFSAMVCFISWYFVDPLVGTAAALFMAWGDGATGLARWAISRAHVKGWEGTATNLVVCSLIALLVEPYWVGLAGAVVFTIAEHLCGDVGKIKWLDDNLGAPMAALVVMGVLL
ncbi:MAG: hypothetical protein Q8R28_14920 [Dehalococcoidia bacterium]|nr:hypothetical protein [Dehalococcoidia bacterium]